MTVTTEQFLDAIFGEYISNGKGYIELRVINQGLDIQRIFCPDITTTLETVDTLKGNIFFGVAPRERMSGTKKDISYITCLWVDIDYGQTGHKKKSGFKSLESAVRHLKEFSIKPSLVISSGNGIHCYWLLSTHYAVVGDDERGRVERILQGLIHHLKGDKGTHDISRILRMPNTQNVKDVDNPKEVEIVKFDTNLKYDLSQFDKIETKTSSTKNICDTSFEEIINTMHPDVHRLIVAGYPDKLGDKSRSEYDFRVICELIKAYLNDDQIYNIFDKHAIGGKHRERNTNYLEYSIKKARKEIINQATAIITPETLTEDLKVKPACIAEKICIQKKLIYAANSFYVYGSGVYKPSAEENIRKLILQLLGNHLTNHKVKEMLEFIKTYGYREPGKLNNTHLINVENGLLNPITLELLPHTPAIYSTIQLDIPYYPEAKCPIWEKTLKEIFEEDPGKIELLQEIFGLCLTRETKYEKAFFFLGEGANGKSVILHTLQGILGDQNYSVIPLEKFDNTNYVAELYGKLANISIETSAKSSVYDSTFKAIVSGDPITADQKYQKPFKFTPHCKLIFALNNMPRVADKTDAFFRRLIILTFNRQFKGKAQNKDLRNILVKEKEGIFIWSLEGSKRLRERGDFNIPACSKEEISRYKKDNNNVLVFVEEKCEVSVENTVTKDVIFQPYKQWCKESGYRSLGKGNFGKELCRHFNIVDLDTARPRAWGGIKLCGGQ